MRRILSTAVLALGLAFAATPALAHDQDPHEGVPEVCVPLLDAERRNAISNHNYLVGLIDAAEQQIWRRDDTIQYLRNANQIKREKIRHLRAELRRERTAAAR